MLILSLFWLPWSTWRIHHVTLLLEFPFYRKSNKWAALNRHALFLTSVIRGPKLNAITGSFLVSTNNFLEWLLCSKHYTKYFTYLFSSNSPNELQSKSILQMKKLRFPEIGNFLQVTSLWSNTVEPRFERRQFESTAGASNHWNTLLLRLKISRNSTVEKNLITVIIQRFICQYQDC